MNKQLETELRAAGYTDKQIAREAAYMAHVAREDAHLRAPDADLVDPTEIMTTEEYLAHVAAGAAA